VPPLTWRPGQREDHTVLTRLGRVTIYVRDQDEALAFYVDKLGLEKRSVVMLGSMRWLTVAPFDQRDLEIVLQQPGDWMGEAERGVREAHIGQGTTWVFFTHDCRLEYEVLAGRGVRFTSPPEDQPYGIEATFEDLYGNSFSLLQPRADD
jgi:predicted enzyme related to lactoylglutathione lyase